MNSAATQIEVDADAKDFEQLIALSASHIRKYGRLALVTLGTFFIFVLLTFLFSSAGSLHAYWSPFGIAADLFSMAALLPVVWAWAMTWFAWSENRGAKREYKEFLQDRYGLNEQ